MVTSVEIELSRDDDVKDVFMDPTGDHVIISTSSDLNYYLHRLSKTLKQLSKFNVSLFLIGSCRVLSVK